MVGLVAKINFEIVKIPSFNTVIALWSFKKIKFRLVNFKKQFPSIF